MNWADNNMVALALSLSAIAGLALGIDHAPSVGGCIAVICLLASGYIWGRRAEAAKAKAA